MSFVDLATLALHRRNEMETRINVFLAKADHAINDIVKLKTQAKSFVQQLNCDPSELKERFLHCMKQLDEYMYLITDFNLAVTKLEENVELAPVHDTTRTLSPQPASHTSSSIQPNMHTVPMHVPQIPHAFNINNIIDMLSESAPTTTKSCANNCVVYKPKKDKVPKAEQPLIQFSSSSTSAESVPGPKHTSNNYANDKLDKQTQCQIVEQMKNITVSENIRSSTPKESFTSSSPKEKVPIEEVRNLPAQTLLQADQSYPAIIMNIDGASFWVMTDEIQDAYHLIIAMTSYYKAHHVEMTLEQVTSLTYCAFYDQQSDSYHRALFIRLQENDVTKAQVFMMDSGDMRVADAGQCIQPLAPQFCEKPPFARCCHLAGIELINFHEKDLIEKQEQFLEDFVGTHCTIEVDDNTSESLGVYVTLKNNQVLNEILVAEGLAVETDKPVQSAAQARIPDGQTAATSQAHSSARSANSGPPEMLDDCEEIDIMDCPEYENPVEAVTGYISRDDAEICKHYKGRPATTCFKGARCKKRHVLKHPDGWTLDRVEALPCRTPALPAPGTWLRVLVTCVVHYDRLYVHTKQDKPNEPWPDFGVVMPPTTLETLLQDMNSPAMRPAYKPLTIAPAPGELVAAQYLDNQWYRARVLSRAPLAEQSLEVQYVDYGNVLCVKEDAVAALEPRFAVLEAQAVCCVLAGVTAKTEDSKQWAQAKRYLATIAQDKHFDAHIIARDYDEITVELFDENGYNVAEQLAARQLVVVKPYDVIKDDNITQRLVVP